jgi:hypothetical protein
MGGGTWCELTKKNRRIEVQFQCNPNAGDRIAGIRETSTCSYLMVIHTPKLCHDLAFVPVKRVGEGEGVHEIVCQKVEEKYGETTEILELPPTKPVITEEATATTVAAEKSTTESPDSEEYLEFIIPSGPLPAALTLLEETITQEISDGKFLRPDGELYNPEDEDTIEYRVELVDDVEDRVFAVLKVRVSKGAKVETEIVMGDNENEEDKLPKSLRKELSDWVEGRVGERPDA